MKNTLLNNIFLKFTQSKINFSKIHFEVYILKESYSLLVHIKHMFDVFKAKVSLWTNIEPFSTAAFEIATHIFWQFSVTSSAFYGSDIANFGPFVTSQLILSNADVHSNTQNRFPKEKMLEKLCLLKIVLFENSELTPLSNVANFPCWLLLLILQFCQLCLWQT